MRTFTIDLGWWTSGVAFTSGAPNDPIRGFAYSRRYEDLDRLERVGRKMKDILGWVDQFNPDCIVAKAASVTVSRGKRPAALDTLMMRGALTLEAAERDLPMLEIPDEAIRLYTVNNAYASDVDLVARANRDFGFPGTDTRACDAWVMAHMARAYFTGEELPPFRRKVMEGVGWEQLTRRKARA